MENPGYVALSRQMVLQRQMSIVANNVANLTTPGFRGESLVFVEHLKTTQPREKVRFVQDIATVPDLQPGPLSNTNNPLDLAIQGEGYFAIETPQGERYSRAGAFALDPDGQIVTTDGFALQGDGGSLVVPPDAGDIVVAGDGTVSTDQGILGRVKLVRSANDYALKREASGLYDADGQPALPVDNPQVQQGKIELSNVAGVVEMTKLVATVRSYQAAATMVEEEHERQRRAIGALATTRS